MYLAEAPSCLSLPVASNYAIQLKTFSFYNLFNFCFFSTYRKIDKLRLRVVSQQEFRAIIESRFNLGLSDAEFEAFLDRVPFDDEGNVKYHDFMGQFDTK